MGRAIVTVPIGTSSVRKAFPELVEQSAAATKAAAPEEKPDTYKERLFKYIPGEVVTLYLCLAAIVASAGNGSRFLDWAIFCVGLIATPFYLWRWQKVTAGLQLTISAVAFAVWVFALGGPFNHVYWYKQVYGAILLPVYTFFVAGASPAPAKSASTPASASN